MNALQLTKRQSTKTSDLCKFCGEWVNLNEEGNQYRDGSCSHEGCEDQDTFDRENESDRY